MAIFQFPGHLKSVTAPTVANSGVSTGRWTLERQMQYQSAGTWPLTTTVDYLVVGGGGGGGGGNYHGGGGGAGGFRNGTNMLLTPG